MDANNKTEEKKKKKEKEVKIPTVLYSAAAIVLVYLAFVAVAVYGFGWNNKIIQKTVEVLPYPAAVLGNHAITLNELNKRTDSVRMFYENQDFSDLGMRVDFGTDDGKKRLKIKEKYILNKLIEDQVMEEEAKKRGLVLTDEMISQEVDRKMKEYGSEDYLKENMQRLYGWSIDDFKENIVKPDMYQEKLLEDIRKNDSSFVKAKEKIEKAQKELDSKKEFSETAQKYSEGDSAKDGGSLGWFSSDQMLPEIAEAAASLDKGKTSAVIESSIGYHIIKMEDKKTEGQKDMFKISQIFVRTETLGDWLGKQEKNMKIYIPLKDYYWDKDSLSVEFRSQDLKDFEDNLRKNSPDDASVMF